MPEQILYESTNRNLTLEQLLNIKDVRELNPNITGPFTDRVTFAEAILMGQAPDTGLFVPTYFPKITLDEIASLKGKPVAEAGYLVHRKFLTQEEISDEALRSICYDAFNFPIPLVRLVDRQYLEMHTESPTADFKNTGARASARFLQYTRPANMMIIRNTDTSGDTGGAIVRADYGVPGIISIAKYPKHDVSKVQEDIMTKVGGNTYAIGIEGAMFTDIQDGLGKRLLADVDLRKELFEMGFLLTSGNSVNWSRVLPQIIHFVWSYAQLADPIGEPVIFSTPMGNGGHGLASEMTRMVTELPMFSLWPTNANDAFPRYTQTGVYKPLKKEEEVKCKSVSMIVRNPGNFGRLAYMYDGQVDKDGHVNKYPNLAAMKKNIYSNRVSMQAEEDTIKYVFKNYPHLYRDYGIIIEPHTSCGVNGLWQFIEKEKVPAKMLCIIQSTSSSYKFADYIEELVGVRPAKPKALEWFDERESTGIIMPFDYGMYRQFVLDIAKKHKR